MATAKKLVTKKAAPTKAAAAKKTSAAGKTAATKSAANKAAPKSSAKKTAARKIPAKKSVARKYGPKASEDVREEMHEFKKHQLHIGKSDKLVTNPKQAIAIGLAKARREGGKVPPNPNTGK